MEFLEQFQPVWFGMPHEDPAPAYTRTTYDQGFSDAMEKVGRWNGCGKEYERGYVEGSDAKWEERKAARLQG